jgi:hypothetical protein
MKALGVPAVLLILAGCGGEEAPESAPSVSVAAEVPTVTPTPEPPPEPTPTPEPAPEGERSQRGNLIKEIGETAGLRETESAKAWMEFQVTGIEVGGECSGEVAEPSENGHFLTISVSAATSSEWPAEMQGMSIDFNASDFSIVGPDGLTENAGHDTFAAFACLPDSELIPAQIGPGEHVIGKVVLDTANTAGVVVYRPWYGYGGGGWEWAF